MNQILEQEYTFTRNQFVLPYVNPTVDELLPFVALPDVPVALIKLGPETRPYFNLVKKKLATCVHGSLIATQTEYRFHAA
jgi:hypothetical protein